MNTFFSQIIFLGVFAFLTLSLFSCNKSKKENSEQRQASIKKPILEKVWTADGLNNPESVIYDAASKAIYVSNVNGNPGDADGNGYIAKLTLDGKVETKQWAKGLDAPKGMAIVNGTLYVADINKIVEISIADAKIVKKHNVKGATFLNDVTADAMGNIYVSNTWAWGTDAMASAIYKLSKGEVVEWIRDSKLNAPNGLLADGDYLYVVSWGEGLDPKISKTFKSNTPGKLMKANVNTKEIDILKDQIGSLDGIVKGYNGKFISDYSTGKIFYTIDDKEIVEIVSDPTPGSADMGINEESRMLYVPLNGGTQIIAYAIK